MTLTDTHTDAADFPADDAILPFSGDEAGLREAADVVTRHRELAKTARPELPEEESDGDPELTKLEWKDGRPKDKPISSKEAADSYAQYREQRAREIMESLQLNWDAEQADLAEPKQLNPEQQTEGQQPEKTDEQKWAEYYQTLPAEQKLHVEQAAQYQQKAQVAEQSAATYNLALSDLIGRLNGVGANAFGDLRTEQDIARLAQQDPARYQQLQTHVATLNAVQAEAQKIQQQQQAEYQQQYQQQFQQWSAHQDKAVEALVPELSDTGDATVRRQLQRGAVETLKEVGFTENELARGWHNGEGFQIRDARVQKILADATKYRALQKGRGEMMNKRAPAPKLMRPGRASNVMADHSADAAMEKFQKSHSIDDAVAVVRARRNRS
jgi:hypothetical protein